MSQRMRRSRLFGWDGNPVRRRIDRLEGDSPGRGNTVWMRARWTAPDGKPRSGWVPVSPGTAVGSRVPEWINRSGAITPPRAQRGDLEGWIAISEVLTPCALALVLGVIGYEGRLFFARRRLAQWGEQCREQRGEP